MKDYDKIAKAIDYIRGNLDRQPTLEEIASQLQLSPFHFQRLFSRWAGVTPKRLLQSLTLESAKELLQQKQASILDIADSIGLSSGSRLYDHFVQMEAVTPSEFKRGGQGLKIHYGSHDSLFGQIFIALTDRGICKLVFIDDTAPAEALNNLVSEWPNAEFIDAPKKTLNTIHALFNHQQTANKPLSLFVHGTNFQVNVWRALLALPEGQLATYGEIASAIGKPKASRAVGTAIGANPIAFLIPCHRVIRQDGSLGGYRWGETRKQAILAREAACLNSEAN